MTLSRFRLPDRLRRTLERLATVVCPPEVETLDLARATVDDMELTLRAMSGGARAALVAGLSGFEMGSVARPSTAGRPFSSLDKEQAAAYFDSWWESEVPPVHELAKGLKALLTMSYYELPEVKASIGYDPDRWIAKVKAERVARHAGDIAAHQRLLVTPDPLRPGPGAGQRRPGGGIFTREHWPRVPGADGPRIVSGRPVMELAADVVIIGSGAGGAVMAAELAEGGLDVIVLEEGGHHRTESFTSGATDTARRLYRDGGSAFALGSPPVLFTEGRCVGGSTVINGGMSWRTPEKVLERWVSEHAVTGAEPAAMARHFARVERFISARPQDPGTASRDNELLAAGARAKGWEVVENIRDQVHCAGSNNCAFGCPTGAKQSTLVSYLPRAVAFGARVYADCRADRVMLDGNRAIGVAGRVVGPDGRAEHRFVVRAREVVLSAGARYTPALLLKSGVKSPSGRIGENLTLHPNAKVVGIYDEPIRGWEGAHQSYQVREFIDEGFLMAAVNVPPSVVAMSLPRYGAGLGETMGAYDRMFIAGILVEDTTTGRVRLGPAGTPLAFYQVTPRDADRIVRGTALLAELLFETGAREVILPFDGEAPLRSADDARRLFKQRIPAKVMELMTVHIMGTCAMGGNADRHVCDPYGRVHGYHGLRVADASLFPTPIGVNPMESIMALATRNAEDLLAAGAGQMPGERAVAAALG